MKGEDGQERTQETENGKFSSYDYVLRIISCEFCSFSETSLTWRNNQQKGK